MAQPETESVDEVDSEPSVIGRHQNVSIKIEDLRKTFAGGTVVACEDINLEIEPDDFVVLLGPSGCGKTTTLRCIAGLETPDSGNIFVGDQDVTEKAPKDRNMAFVFQTITLFPHMTVRRNMRFGLDMKTDLSKAEKNQRVDQAAETLGIADFLDREPSDLSGGQQQRVSLGRAMVTEPAGFLLDEPFSALDANLRDQMQTEVQMLQQELETAMIFVTHDQEEAMTLGNKIVVMRDGRIQQIGSPYEVYNEPANRFVAEFIGSPSTNMFECEVVKENGEINFVTDRVSLPAPQDSDDILEDYVGQFLSIGVRPEYLNLGDRGHFEAEIELVEPQGSHDVIHLDASGKELRATVPQGQIGGSGEVDMQGTTTSVEIDLDKLWVFDGDERLI